MKSLKKRLNLHVLFHKIDIRRLIEIQSEIFKTSSTVCVKQKYVVNNNLGNTKLQNHLRAPSHYLVIHVRLAEGV